MCLVANVLLFLLYGSNINNCETGVTSDCPGVIWQKALILLAHEFENWPDEALVALFRATS